LTSPHDDLPPAFPEWLKRRIPLLRAEETNVLLQTLRRRRELYPPSGLARFAGHANAVRGILWGLSIPLLLGTVLAGGKFTRCVFLIVSISLVVQSIPAAFGRFGKRDGAALPMTVSEVCGVFRSSRQAGLDLWLTGIRGRDVKEAIYLEAMSAAWKPTSIFSANVAFGPFYLIYPRESFGNPLLFVVACLTTSWLGTVFGVSR